MLDDELTAADPASFEGSIDLGASGFDQDALTAGGLEMYEDGNLGGNSLYSEILSYEVLARCELAELVKTETEILYEDVGGKKTDYLALIDGLPIGVSVTRAFGFPPDAPYTVEQAADLLEDKLADVQLSSANVSAADAWGKQILHVIAYAEEHAGAVAAALEAIDPPVRGDTIVFVSVTDGTDDWVY